MGDRIYILYTTNNLHITHSNIVEIFKKIIFGKPYYHLWFLYLIIGIYILSPLVRIFVQNAGKQGLEISIVLFFIFGCCIKLINSIFSIYSLKISIYFPMPEFTGYVGYFIAGYYFANYSLSRRIKIFFYLAGVISVLFTFFGTLYLSLKFDKALGNLYNYIMPHTLLVTFAIFIFIKSLFEHKKFSEFSSNLIIKISSLTFGIYLLHALVLNYIVKNIKYFKVAELSDSTAVVIPILAVIVFIISSVIIYIFSNFTLFKKYAM